MSRRIAVALLLTVGVAACGSGHHDAGRTTTTSTSTTTTAPASTSTSSSTTSSPAAPGTTKVTSAVRTTTSTTAAPIWVNLSDSDNGHAVSVHRGDLVIVVLHSTYWRFTTPASPVVSPDGTPTVEPALQGCVPGGGCGTVTARYRATAAGAVTLTAHRDSCGEALACTGGAGDWRVPLTVS